MVVTRQCPKLSFYFVHSQGALPIKLCTRKLLHAPSQYIAIINGSVNVHTPGAYLLKSCTRPWKCAHRVQGAPLISDTARYLADLQEKVLYSSMSNINIWVSFSQSVQLAVFEIIGCTLCVHFDCRLHR